MLEMRGLTGGPGYSCRLPHGWHGCAILRKRPHYANASKSTSNLSPFSSLDEELQQHPRQLDFAQGLQALLERDDFKERSRPFFRTQFDHERWVAHRSTSRYARHMLGIARSRMVRGLAQPLLYVMGVATAVATYQSLFQAGLLPASWPDLELHSKEPFGLTSFALSLLLVFRTNASYSRWLDARKTWGLVINRTRDIVRQGLSYIPPDQQALRDMLCRWAPAFPRALMCHIRQDSQLERELQGVLLAHELESLLAAEHRPNFVLQVLSQILDESQVSTPAWLRMDENITAFEDCLGTCERILRTPIPLSYTRHTSRFMIIWLTLLPFMLWENCHWATVPLCCIIAFLLLGIEEIGVSIEEPFSILALEALCETVLRNVRELQSMHSSAGAGGVSGSGNGSGRRAFTAAQLVEMRGGGPRQQAGGSIHTLASGHEATSKRAAASGHAASSKHAAGLRRARPTVVHGIEAGEAWGGAGRGQGKGRYSNARRVMAEDERDGGGEDPALLGDGRLAGDVAVDGGGHGC